METTQKVNLEWLTRITGDPFADVGGIVIKILSREKETDDIFKLIEDVLSIYVKDWQGKLNAFFLNSTITQPSFKGDRKITETKKFFKALLEESLPFEEGYCRILGEKTKLFTGGRDNHILSGSGTFINFHHAFQGGVMLSKEALIRMFFAPMGCVQLSDKIALLNSNTEELIEFFTANNIHENSRRIATKISDGISRSAFKNPSSALFDFALKWIREAKQSDLENTELTLYHFTNFGASPEVVLHSFSASLFTFYANVQHRTIKPDWDKFSHSYFKQKNASYQYESDTFEVTEKKETDTLGYEDYKTWRNSLYQSLLDGRSILKPMLDWVSKKRRPLNFKIVKLYQTTLRDMDEKTLKIIERIAGYVLLDSNNIKKNLRNLQKPQKAHAFRTALRRLEEKNLTEKNPEPLFSLEEYALELFPDGTYWQEIQDLLLIAIYQKMHEQEIWLDNEDLPVEETEEETINS
ncbi:MAG: type I-B CRISPR-associated protein Cas8b1/Cst1 [bacterium]|nr:type I-B CRISPR-associated protein Cas8b1/Cst1 [bacterium]